MQTLNTIDDKTAGAFAGDVGSHGAQQMDKINNLWLFRSIFQHSCALGERGGHEQIFRCAHGNCFKTDVRAGQAIGCLCLHIATGDGDFCPHLFQGADMQVHRPGANGAAARKGHPRPADARQ